MRAQSDAFMFAIALEMQMTGKAQTDTSLDRRRGAGVPMKSAQPQLRSYLLIS